MPFWDYYGNGVIAESYWLVYWVIKGMALYLVLWALGITKKLASREVVTDYEGDGSPAAAAMPVPELKQLSTN